MDDFNTYFEKIWKSIPNMIRLTNAQALVYYRKSFHLDLDMLIVIFKHDFSKVYQTTKTSKHTLVSSRKLLLKSLMPPFINVPPKLAPLPILHIRVLAFPPPPL